MPATSIRFKIKNRIGEEINVFEPSLPCPKREIEAFNTLISRSGSARIRTSQNHTYNCHGFTFISKLGHIGSLERERRSILLLGQNEYLPDEEEGQNDIWKLLYGNGWKKIREIGNLNINRFKLSDGICRGDVAIYFKGGKIAHSCVVYDVEEDNTFVNITVLSKFGRMGEYFHLIDDKIIIKLYGITVSIWSDR
jgi:hypothetical protein